MRVLSLFTFCFFTIAITACEQQASEEETEQVAEEINEEKFSGQAEDDAEFLSEAYSFNLMIKAYNEVALQKPETPDYVREFAVQSSEYHQELNDTISRVAEVNNVALPSTVGENVTDYIENIQDEEPDEFAEEYADVMEDIHERLIDSFTEAARNANDSDLRAWAMVKLGELEERNQMIEEFEERAD